MDFAGLPHDILLLVLSYLEACDLLRCHFVCRRWKACLSDVNYIRTVLRSTPHAREVRSLLAENPDALHYSSSSVSPDTLAQIFRTVACRYHHLKQGKIRTLNKYPLRALDQSGNWQPTPQWDYHESQPGGRMYHETASHIQSASRKPYLFRPSLWSYDDGFVVFAPRQTESIQVTESSLETDAPWRVRDGLGESGEQFVLAVLDLESGSVQDVPFDVTDRVIRNTRLKDGTLVIEWAERDPFHELNLVDKVHRHFATIYDVGRRHGSGEKPESAAVSVTFRSEFKIHFLGIPLTARDHFFSTHTRKHFALYLWQPNRSLWTGDEDQPIEALFIWDIRSPSPYRPSEDPGNMRRNQHSHIGPTMTGRFSFRELDFLGIRQRASIALIQLGLEEVEDDEEEGGSGNVIWKENVFVSGQGYFDPAERHWQSRVTRFPFKAHGPAQVCVGEEELVAYRGTVSMESSALEPGEVEKWFLPVMDAVDRDARVRFALLETCFSGLGAINRVEIRIKVGEEEDGEWQSLDGAAARELIATGRIAGDERWIVGMNAMLELVVGRFQ